MYLTSFPDINWVKKNASQGFVDKKDYLGNKLIHKGWPNVILNVKSSQTERDHIKGPFSFFYNLSGSSLIGLDQKWYKSSDNFYCISNKDQHFSLHLPKDIITETFNIHFGQFLYEDVLQLLLQNNHWALDNFGNNRSLKLNILPKTNYLTPELRNKIIQLHHYKKRAGSDYCLDTEYELTTTILEHILIDSINKLRKIDQIKSLKASTKEELFRRVNIGIDFIHDHQMTVIDLNSISRTCGLSKFHFIRVFKEIYNQTPTEFIASLKIQKANHLIYNAKLSLSQIADELGFSELSAFTRFYKRQTGLSPSSVKHGN